MSFKDNEGWVIGKPAILLHTADGGKTWERVPLSPKLPGEPSSVKAFGANKAEMTTTAGAVYVTTNAGRNWKAQVKETIDATLNRISSSGVSGVSSRKPPSHPSRSHHRSTCAQTALSCASEMARSSVRSMRAGRRLPPPPYTQPLKSSP